MIPSHPTHSRVALQNAVVVALGSALLVVSVRQAGAENIAASVSSIGAWLMVVVALGAARMALRARAWAVCSRADHPEGLPFPAAFAAVLAGDALGNLTPLGLLASEPAKVVLARKHVSTAASLSSVAVENAFYTASVLAMLLAGGWVLLQRAAVPALLERLGEVILAAAAIAGLGAIWIFRARPALLSRLGHWVARLTGRPGVAATFGALERSVYDVVHWPTARLIEVALCQGAFHVLAVAEVWLILRLMPGGEGTPLVDAFLMEATGRFITVAFKFIPYRLGVDELGSGSIAQVIGIGAPAGVSLALVRRVRILVLNVAGIVLLARHRHR